MITTDTIVVVSGLPRSGTSLMMAMLQAGGLPVLTDQVRAADEDNPGGYYELERVKQIEAAPAFLDEARGKAVKIISELLKYIPAAYQCKVLLMRRDMREILASQRQMLIRRGKPAAAVSDDELAALFEKHLARIEEWLARQPHLEALPVNYNELLREPTRSIAQINAFLGGTLDEQGMVRAIDPALYRQRST